MPVAPNCAWQIHSVQPKVASRTVMLSFCISTALDSKHCQQNVRARLMVVLCGNPRNKSRQSAFPRPLAGIVVPDRTLAEYLDSFPCEFVPTESRAPPRANGSESRARSPELG